MENSENKSLVSTGSSNLVKTEKLLSITKKILSEIKPQFESVRIGNQEWMTRNLDVDRFRNGDLIPQIESDEEWKKVGENGQPAWCYYDNHPDNGKKYGKLYNWFAVNDPRGLAPEGYHVPSDEDWSILVKFLGGESIAGHKIKSSEGWKGWEDEDGKIQNCRDNSSGFNALPGGYRTGDGSFNSALVFSFFWSATEDDYYAYYISLSNNFDFLTRLMYFKTSGASVRCLRDDYNSI